MTLVKILLLFILCAGQIKSTFTQPSVTTIGVYSVNNEKSSIYVKDVVCSRCEKLSDYFKSEYYDGYLNEEKNPVAVVRFEDTLLSTGWGILDIETNPRFKDPLQAYAAGFAEGYVTAYHIYNHSVNLAEYMFLEFNVSKSLVRDELTLMPKKLRSFLQKQEKWTRKQIQNFVGSFDEEYENESDKDYGFWFQVGLLMEQFEGLIDGYAHRVEVEVHFARPESDFRTGTLNYLPRWVFQMLNGIGDLLDLVPALLSSDKETPKHIKESYDYFNMGKREAEFLHASRTSCTAIVKILPGNEDLLVGHNAWFTYQNTNRIFKHYFLNYNHKSTAAAGISFSSYPGFLESLDDFYMMSSGLTMTQTSIGVLNTSIYGDSISYDKLLAWQRVRVASIMARSGPAYFKYMKMYHSGTYSNQYMVVDYNLFVPGKDLADNTLFVIEEIPGLIMGADQSEILRYGYWPSYNVPVYDEVFIRSGYQTMVDKYGAHQNRFSHSLAPRAEIFRRDNVKIDSISGLKQILRYNDFKWDNYSIDVETDLPNPALTLCARGDLYRKEYLDELNLADALKHKGSAYGCYDAKVTSFHAGAMQRNAEIISGPTSKVSMGAPYLEPFTWNTTTVGIANSSHVGLPVVYNFSYMTTKPFYQERPNISGPHKNFQLKLKHESTKALNTAVN